MRCFYRIEYSRKEQGAKLISIKDAFVEKDLNTINPDGITISNLLEDFFDKFYERTFGRSINKIFRILFENEKDDIFDSQDYDNVLSFCILSYLRTPQKLKEIHIQSLRRSYLFSIFKKPDDTLPNIDKNFILIKTLFDGLNVILKNLRGITLRIAFHTFKDEYFLLADSPLALVNSNNMEFASPDLDIVIPVSSNVVLIFSKTENASDITHIKKRETIENINKQLCANYYKYIACADKDYLESFVQKNNPIPATVPTIEAIEAEKEVIINNIKEELVKNPHGRYIRITRNGIEFLN